MVIIRLLIVVMFLFPSAALVWADNQAASVDSLKEEAAQGYSWAQAALGFMYSQGHGVPQDYAAALKWYRLAATHGNATAQYNLGVLYFKGQGVAPDYAEALKWYRLAAAQGDGDAQFNLGAIYA
jgi:TPR repeat protein